MSGANEVVGAKEVSTTTLRDSMTVDGKDRCESFSAEYRKTH